MIASNSSFFNKDGEPLESAPEHTLYKASKTFTEVTGMEFQAMGELHATAASGDVSLPVIPPIVLVSLINWPGAGVYS